MKRELDYPVNAASLTHVIFDCDGVLVDSETLSARVLTGMMEEIGLPITPDVFRSDFLGRSFASAAQKVVARYGRAMPDDFQMKYRARLLAVMQQELQAMPGIPELLPRMKAPYWLATSSSPPRLEVSLRVTGLEKWFSGKCSTASEVENGKPAPDLFLLAANRLGTAPQHCVVIEDSEMGVLAALNAGMQVWHFQGGAHVKAGYKLPGTLVPHRSIPDADALKQAFAALGLCSL